MKLIAVFLNRGGLLAIFATVGLLVSACSPSQSYEESINRIFKLDVSKVEYLDRGGLDNKKVYEGDDVAMVRSWLLSATPPTYIGSYPKAEYRMIIYFGNNQTETVYLSGDESGYVMIEYMGHVLMAPPMPVRGAGKSGTPE